MPADVEEVMRKYQESKMKRWVTDSKAPCSGKCRVDLEFKGLGRRIRHGLMGHLSRYSARTITYLVGS